MKFWRNSSIQYYPKLKAIMLYSWLIPGVPAGTFLTASLLDSRASARSTSDVDYLMSVLTLNTELSIGLLTLIGIILWLWTVRTLNKPVFHVQGNTLNFYGYGIFKDEIALDTIEEIRTYNVGPLGHLIDFRTHIGASIRAFAFLSNINKDKLTQFFKEYDVKVS